MPAGRTSETSEPPTFRYNVVFEATDGEHGRAIVKLALGHEGVASVPSTTFFLEPKKGMTLEDTWAPRPVPHQHIARLGFNLPGAAEPKEP